VLNRRHTAAVPVPGQRAYLDRVAGLFESESVRSPERSANLYARWHQPALSGVTRLFTKADGYIYSVDEIGTVVQITGPGGIASGGNNDIQFSPFECLTSTALSNISMWEGALGLPGTKVAVFRGTDADSVVTPVFRLPDQCVADFNSGAIPNVQISVDSSQSGDVKFAAALYIYHTLDLTHEDNSIEEPVTMRQTGLSPEPLVHTFDFTGSDAFETAWSKGDHAVIQIARQYSHVDDTCTGPAYLHWLRFTTKDLDAYGN